MLNRLKALRDGMDFSQSDAAEYVGMSREQWNRLETGKCNPNVVTALQICACFGVRVDDVFELEDSDWEI